MVLFRVDRFRDFQVLVVVSASLTKSGQIRGARCAIAPAVPGLSGKVE